MEIVYDLWHLAFANLIEQRAPPNFEVQSEVRLSIEPQRADLLLLRRLGTERRDHDARVLLDIWPRLSKVTVAEFKSPSKSSFRHGDLVRLWSYGSVYQTAHITEVPLRSDLTLLLVIPSLIPTLLEEIAAMGWELCDLGRGYRRIDGAVYDLYVAVTDEVAEAERDEFLRIFSHKPVTDPAISRWFRHWIAERNMTQNVKDIPGFEEMWQKLLDDLTPEQRLRGLSLTQQLLALPDEVLRELSDAYVSTLPPEGQKAIRQRLGRSK